MVSAGCGIDVHQDLIVASIHKSEDEVETREFEACKSFLTGLREWCKSEGVTHVAMESTGVYWKPVFNVPEEDFEVILVNARHTWSQDGQERQPVVEQVFVKRLVERQFHTSPGHTGVTGSGTLPQEGRLSGSR